MLTQKWTWKGNEGYSLWFSGMLPCYEIASYFSLQDQWNICPILKVSLPGIMPQALILLLPLISEKLDLNAKSHGTGRKAATTEDLHCQTEG